MGLEAYVEAMELR